MNEFDNEFLFDDLFYIETKSFLWFLFIEFLFYFLLYTIYLEIFYPFYVFILDLLHING